MTQTTRPITAIIACYNDGGSVRAMYTRLSQVLEAATPHWQIVFVNDASPDDAAVILRELAAADRRVVVVTHSRNFGSQMAFSSGMRVATGDAVILLDGDLQDPPEIIPQFIVKWLAGYDVVYGVRRRRHGESAFRRAGYKVFYRLFRKLADVTVPVDAGDFSLIDRKVFTILRDMPERDLFMRGLRAWVGFRQIGVEYDRAERYDGRSTNSLIGNFRWARRGITNFSVKPLEYVTYLAMFVSALAALGIFAYVAVYFLQPDAPRGFMTILVAVLFLGAVQLLALAVLGDYLGRIFLEIKGRPRFIVTDIQNDPRVNAEDAARPASRIV
jgi:glycosyltransferase involved in cell wall biosynthesis